MAFPDCPVYSGTPDRILTRHLLGSDEDVEFFIKRSAEVLGVPGYAPKELLASIAKQILEWKNTDL